MLTWAGVLLAFPCFMGEFLQVVWSPLRLLLAMYWHL